MRQRGRGRLSCGRGEAEGSSSRCRRLVAAPPRPAIPATMKPPNQAEEERGRTSVRESSATGRGNAGLTRRRRPVRPSPSLLRGSDDWIFDGLEFHK
ncbi:uncharacterized protein DS421_1g12200 [Arachis hypogaea]|nr:uncharacterized protein DS421_1g12200 [Arachis hypogaea]